jgi:hypothetical protein
VAQETIRDVINQTFRALRDSSRIASGTTVLADDGTDQDEVKTFELVADAIEEICSKHTWRAYHARLTMTYTAAQDSVNCPAGVFEDAELLRDITTGRVLAWDITDSANPRQLEALPTTAMYLDQEEDLSVTQDLPCYITLTTDGDTPAVRLFPVPTANRSLAFWIYNPPERIAPTTAAVLDTIIKLPARALRRLVVWWSAEERGEELGESANLLKDRYEAALVEEIQADQRAQGAYEDQLYAGRPI